MARLSLLEIGPPALPTLVAAVEEDCVRHKNGQQHRFHQITRLTTLIAQIGQPQSLPILVRVALLGALGYEEFREPLELYLHRLKPHEIVTQLPTLLNTLEELAQQGSPCAVTVGQILVSQAELEPSSEYRAAIPFLKPQFGKPLQFIGLHKRLKKALANAHLPIPATRTALSDADLPLPTQEDVS